MSYELTIDNDFMYAEVKFFDQMQLHKWYIANTEVALICDEYGLSRVLVDLVDVDKSKSKISVLEMVEFSSTFKGSSLSADVRIAGIITSNDKAGRLLEAFISSFGVNIKFFLSRDDAIIWLLAR